MRGMSHVVAAEIPANVLSVAVEVGQRVAPGDELALLDSMKMEIPVLADVSGVVEEVVVVVGDAVHDGDPLVVITRA